MMMTDKRSTDTRPYDFMSISHTNAIRGVLMLIIILYHESLYLGIEIMPREGAYAVMMFFFLSGYGLYLSSDKPNYFRDFVQKKIVGLILRYWIIELLMVLVVAILFLSTDGIIDNMIGVLFSRPHWYVFQLLFFYLFFYLAFLAFRDKRYSVLVLCLTIPVLMYMQFRFFQSNLYLRSGLGFVFGLLFARHKGYFDRIPAILRIVLVICAGCFLFFIDDYSYKVSVYVAPIFFLMMALILSSIDLGWYSAILVMLGAAIYATGSVTCGVAVILAGLCEFAYTSSVLSRMGKYSLEVYLIHYTFLTYFYEEFSIDDPLLLFLIVATVSIMVSVIIKFVSDFILNRFNTAVSKVGNESCAGITPK